MTREAENLWRLLYQRHRGHRNAVTSGVLASVMMTSRRRISILTRELIDAGHPVAAGDAGYYVAETAEEKRRYLETLYARAKDTLRRYSRFRKAPLHEIMRQLELELTDESGEQLELPIGR